MSNTRQRIVRSRDSLQRQAQRWWTKLQAMGYVLCSDHSLATGHQCVTTCPTITTTIAEYKALAPDTGYGVDEAERYLGWAGPGVVFVRVGDRPSQQIGDTLIHELLHYTVPRLPHWKVDWLAAQFVRGRTGKTIRAARTQREAWAIGERKRLRERIRLYQSQIADLRKQLRALG